MDYRTFKDAIPWDILVKEGLRLVEMARQAKSERTEEQARSAPSADAQGSIDALRRRLDAAEEQNRRDAEVAEQMAQQVRRLSEAAEDLRGRTRLALWLAGGALGLADRPSGRAVDASVPAKRRSERPMATEKDAENESDELLETCPSTCARATSRSSSH